MCESGCKSICNVRNVKCKNIYKQIKKKEKQQNENIHNISPMQRKKLPDYMGCKDWKYNNYICNKQRAGCGVSQT